MGNDRYLIKNSTKEERQKRVDGAIVVGMLDGKEPSVEAKELFQKYVDGEMEVEEVQRKIVEKYKKHI